MVSKVMKWSAPLQSSGLEGHLAQVHAARACRMKTRPFYPILATKLCIGPNLPFWRVFLER